MSVKSKSGTAERIMDAAQQMVQTRGYNAFSYADISAHVGIRKASIHYHFPSKKDLGKQLVARYRKAFSLTLEQIDLATADPRRKLKSYARLYLDALMDTERMCLCGMLASDITTLPAEVRDEVIGFFIENEEWLTKVLASGRRTNVFSFTGTASTEAQLFLAALEGAMLIARSYGDEVRFRAIVQKLLNRLES